KKQQRATWVKKSPRQSSLFLHISMTPKDRQRRTPDALQALKSNVSSTSRQQRRLHTALTTRNQKRKSLYLTLAAVLSTSPSLNWVTVYSKCSPLRATTDSAGTTSMTSSSTSLLKHSKKRMASIFPKIKWLCNV